MIVKPDGENIDEAIQPTLENMTIILEISKFFGKDLNVVVTYDIFKKINSKNLRPDGTIGYRTNEYRNMFIVALQNLKFMGYFSASRGGSTFLFKKNYYGKP
jgi:hypothetical protein